VSFYFNIFSPHCFVLAVAAVSAELKAMLQNKICVILLFLCRFVDSTHIANSVQNSARAG